MSNQSETTQWIIGSDIACDVCVVDKRIAPRHASLINKASGWSIQPLDGKVTVAGKLAASTVSISPADDVRLGDNIPLPWPYSEGAARVLSVGRAPECDIVLNSPNVSGCHARLIVGQKGTFVLEDANSRNGIFHEAFPQQRVRRLALRRGMKVFFGTYQVIVTDLLDSQQVSDAITSNVKSKSSSESSSLPASTLALPASTTAVRWLPMALGAIAIPLILLSIYIFRPAGNPSTNRDSQTALSEKPSEPTEPEITDNVDPAKINPKRPAVSLPPTQPANPADSLYWIVFETKSDKTAFRIGTGVAISPQRIITTGSIIQASQELVEIKDGVVQLIQLTSGKRQSVFGTGIYPEFTKRHLAYQQIIKRLGEAEKLSDSDPAKAKDVEQLSNLVNLAMASMSAVDIGWIETNKMDSILPIASALTLRPNQEATVMLSGFQKDDPFFDMADERPIESETVKIKGFGPAVENFGKGIRLMPLALFGNKVLHGCPLVIRGKLVSIISYSGYIPDEDADLIESVAPEAINTFIQSF